MGNAAGIGQGAGNAPRMLALQMKVPQMQQQQTRMMAPAYSTQSPSFQQMQAQMDAQRKQYEAYAKQIAVQQKAMADAFQKAQAKDPAAPAVNVTAPAVAK
ncbi:MAG TPA: hypothetical protein EYH35_00110 [Thiotrichaceae bacterium]|nr:hypothetical protein [Thiotrichaceae bacterium]